MRYWFLVFSNPHQEVESSYNDWYDHQHLPDLLQVPGIIAAKRLQFSGVQFNPTDSAPARYLAVYEIEADDPSTTFAEIRSRIGTASMPMTEAIDLSGLVTMTFAAR